MFLFLLYVSLKNVLGITKFVGTQKSLRGHCPRIPPVATDLATTASNAVCVNKKRCQTFFTVQKLLCQ